MYDKNSRAHLVQKPQRIVLSGIGMKPPTLSYEIPAYISGRLGFLAGQIMDPFEHISRSDFRKRL